MTAIIEVTVWRETIIAYLTCSVSSPLYLSKYLVTFSRLLWPLWSGQRGLRWCYCVSVLWNMIFSCYNVTLKSSRSVSIDKIFACVSYLKIKVCVVKYWQNLHAEFLFLIWSEVNLWVSICHLPELVSVISDLISIIRVPTWMNIVRLGVRSGQSWYGWD